MNDILSLTKGELLKLKMAMNDCLSAPFDRLGVILHIESLETKSLAQISNPKSSCVQLRYFLPFSFQMTF
jgi:hypothetical protein